jgi:hypothetical protein
MRTKNERKIEVLCPLEGDREPANEKQIVIAGPEVK